MELHEYEHMMAVWLEDIADGFRHYSVGFSDYLSKHVNETLTPEMIVEAIKYGSEFAYSMMNHRSDMNDLNSMMHEKKEKEGST